jgi:hypothetical protein
MMRHPVHDRASLAEGAGAPARQSSAPAGAIALRLIVAPLAAIAAAVAGLLFAVLLPICGIATISEGIAKASWRFLRDTMAHLAPHARKA